MNRVRQLRQQERGSHLPFYTTVIMLSYTLVGSVVGPGGPSQM